MKKTRAITRIIAAALIMCMLFALTSCLDAVGGLKVESFTVDRNSVKTEYFVGDEIDFSGIKINVTYSDETLNTVYTHSNAKINVIYDEDITATTGTKTVKVSMKDPETNVTQEAKVTITVMEDPNAVKFDHYRIDSSAMKTEYDIGQTIDFTGIKVYEVMTDDSENEVADASKITYVYDAATITATAGNKQIQVKYDGNDAGTIAIRVNNPAVETVDIIRIAVTGEYDANYEVGDTVNFAGLTVAVTYEGGTIKTIELSNLTIGAVDTLTTGKKTVIVKFTDPVNNEEQETSFEINVIAKKLTAVQFEKPSTITAFESDNKTEGKPAYGEAGFAGTFVKGGFSYKVGDDNAFRFVPYFAVMDGTEVKPEVKPLSTYYTTVELSIYAEGNYTALTSTAAGNTVSFYNGETLIATVDTFRGEYDFSDAAVGSKIKLSVLPSAEYYNSSANAVELEVEVIDAYNVTEAWQLAVIDNYQEEWAAIKNRRGIAGYNPAGVVLHNDILITAHEADDPELDVVPRAFFFVTDHDVTYTNSVTGETKVVPAGTKYLDDGTTIYYHFGGSDFVIEGNFFNISLQSFPIVASPAVFGADADKDYSDDYSNASLFRFDSSEYQYLGQPDDIQNVTINNIALKGNAARDNWVDENGDLVSAGGLIFLKSADYSVTTMNNTIANSFFITYFPDRTGAMYVNDSKCYDSYQNAAFVYGNVTFEIKDSFINGSGGPLFIASSCVDDIEDENEVVLEEDARFSPTVKVTNTVMDSTLTGSELWFSAVGATTMVGSIKAIGDGLQAGRLGNFKDADGNMNIYTLIMNEGYSAADAIGNPDTEGTAIINGKGIARWKSELLWGAIYSHPAFKASTPAPFFTVTDADGNPGFLANPEDPASLVPYAIFFNGTTFCDILGNELGTQLYHENLVAAFAAADTITLSQGGMSIVLEFYH